MRANPIPFILTFVVLVVPASASEAPGAHAASAAEDAWFGGSAMHPAFLPLDAQGNALAPPAEAADATKTCGQCHDVAFIAETSSHMANGVNADCFKCHATTGKAGWPSAAFDKNGMVHRGKSGLQGTNPANCALCHGIVHTGNAPLALPKELGQEPLTDKLKQRFDLTKNTGAIFSGQEVRRGHVNVEERGDWLAPWDVHAQRQLACGSCHHASNDLVQAKKQVGALPYLKFDPRRPTVGAFLDRPNHNLVTETCTSCHVPGAAHDFLPQRERHMARVACTACHAPRLNAPTLKSVDETVVAPTGFAPATWRCVNEADKTCVHEKLVSGLVPYLLPETDTEGKPFLNAFNLVTRYQWFSGDDLVPFETVKKAWLEGEAYAPEVVAGFDGDGNGLLDELELRLDNEQKVALIATRLTALGVTSPEIRGTTEAFPIAHGVINGERVLRDCAACHSSDARLTADVPLAPYVPAGATLRLGPRAQRLTNGSLQVTQAGLEWQRNEEGRTLHVLGFSKVRWTDLMGLGLLSLVALGIVAHGALRFASRKKRAHVHGPTSRVYMYSTYERIWHWLMAVSVIALIGTGLEIHTGGEFGLLGFATAVRMHNAFAAVMLLNGFLALFFHLASGWIRNFIPDPNSFARRFEMQISYYTRGIFMGAPHPDKKSPDNKLNVMQQLTYLALLNVLMPFQVGTGVLMGIASWKPQWLEWAGGLATLAPLHNLGSWFFLSFLVLHMYLVTTGHTLTSNLKAMLDGHEEIPLEEPQTVTHGGNHE